eukprot:CFRG1351T1
MKKVFLTTRLESECSKKHDLTQTPKKCKQCSRIISNLGRKIKFLDGVLIKSKKFDSNATCLLTSNIIPGEKLLCSIAAGLWILHPSFVTDSYTAGAWLDPVDYEWTIQPHKPFLCYVENISVDVKELLTACRARRREREVRAKASQGEGNVRMFAGWNAFVMLEDSQCARYSAVIEAGGAQIGSREHSDLITHVIVESPGILLPKFIPKNVVVVATITIMRSVLTGDEIGDRIVRSSEQYEPKTRMMKTIINDYLENNLDADCCAQLLVSLRIFCQTGRLPKARTVECLVKNILPTQTDLVVECIATLNNLKALHPPHRTPLAWAPGRGHALNTNCISSNKSEANKTLNRKRKHTSMSEVEDDCEDTLSDWKYLTMVVEYLLELECGVGWRHDIFGDMARGKDKWVKSLSVDGCLAGVQYMVSVLEECDNAGIASAGNVHSFILGMIKEESITTDVALKTVLRWVSVCLGQIMKSSDISSTLVTARNENVDKHNMMKSNVSGTQTHTKTTNTSTDDAATKTRRLTNGQQKALLFLLQKIVSMIICSLPITDTSPYTALKQCYTSLDGEKSKECMLETILCNSVETASCKLHFIQMVLGSNFGTANVPPDAVAMSRPTATPCLAQIVGCFFFLNPVETSLGHKVRAEKRTTRGQTDLMVECSKTRADYDKVEKLLAIGEAVGVQDIDGYTPLHKAAVHGDAKLTRMLLEGKEGMGVDDYVIKETGATPLQEAVRKCHVEVAEILLREGADPDYVDYSGSSARDYAESQIKAMRNLFNTPDTITNDVIVAGNNWRKGDSSVWMNTNVTRLRTTATWKQKRWTAQAEELLALILHYSSAYLVWKRDYTNRHPHEQNRTYTSDLNKTQARRLTEGSDDQTIRNSLLVSESVAAFRNRLPASNRIEALCHALVFTLQHS